MRQYTTISRYKLEIGPAWHTYTTDQLAEICNGVGASGQAPWLAALLAALPYLTPASIPHDIDYHAGGSSRDRRAADRRFRRNCFRVARAQIGGVWRRLFRSTARAQWAFAVFEINAAYAMLRVAGRPAFNYTAIEEPAEEERP